MALVATPVILREDIAIFDCSFLAADTTGTLTNGTDFTFRNLSAVLTAPALAVVTLQTTGTAPTPVCAVAAGANITLTKINLANSECTFRVVLYGTKSKVIN
jgi:hypothetical protein